jgi:uncharacterized protein DUF1176
MRAPWVVVAMAILGAASARAESLPTARALFEGAWKRAACNQHIDQALNNSRYQELGGGYSLGMVLCWLGPHSDAQILFLVAPRTGGRPQLLRFEEWRGKAFVPVEVLPLPEYNAETKTLVSYRRYGSSGICATAGEWAWTGTEFKMTGYWDKPDCNDETEFDRSDDFRVFPRKK